MVRKKKRKIDCGGPRATYCRERLNPPSRCAKSSFRTKSLVRGRKLVICCPKGKWRARRCTVGTIAQSLLRPMTADKCRVCRLARM